MSVKTFPLGDQKHILQFDVNAVCEAEEVFQEDISSVLENKDRMKQSRTIRVLLWAALLEHHPEITLRDVGKLIEEQGMDAIGKSIIGALHVAYPDKINADGSPKKK